MKSIVCFGDSLTNGARDEYYRNYPMELSSLIWERKGEYCHCLNYGVNGETTSHMLDRAYAVLSPNRDAAFVLFMGGTNDTKVPIPRDIYYKNVQAVILLARALGLRIALGLLPPIYGPGLLCYSQEQGNETIVAYNNILGELAATQGLSVCDFSRYPPELFCDGVHMNHAGYQQMALDWYEVIGLEI